MTFWRLTTRLGSATRLRTTAGSLPKSSTIRWISQLSRSHEYSFDGRRFDWEMSPINSPSSSFDLLTAISNNPQIVQTLQKVNLDQDRHGPSVDTMSDNILEMFRRSHILTELGLQGDLIFQYAMQETLSTDPHPGLHSESQLGKYSQSAAAFLLTQLLEVRQLMLPLRWKANDLSSVVLKCAICLAYFESPALRKLEWITVRCLTEDLEFMALPRLKCFVVEEGLITKKRREKPLPELPNVPMGLWLETLAFHACCVDAKGIDYILGRAPRLTNLWYTHGFTATEEYAAYDPKDPTAAPLSEERWFEECEPWDICGFIKAVQERSGRRLEELGITFCGTRMPLVPGSADFRGFEKLQHLDISLEYFVNQLRNGDCVLADLLPQSLSLLNIHTWGEGEKQLDAVRRIFEGFREVQVEKLPALESVRIVCSDEADEVFLEECKRIERDCAGLRCEVVLDLIDEDILN